MKEMRIDDKLTIKGLVGQYGFKAIIDLLIFLMKERANIRMEDGDLHLSMFWENMANRLMLVYSQPVGRFTSEETERKLEDV